MTQYSNFKFEFFSEPKKGAWEVWRTYFFNGKKLPTTDTSLMEFIASCKNLGDGNVSIAFLKGFSKGNYTQPGVD